MFKIQKLLIILAILTQCYTISPPLITPAPQLFPRAVNIEPGEDASECSGYYSIAKSCTHATPGFLSLLPESQIQCVCYSSSTFAPSIFDGYLDQCLAYLKTASPDVYSAYGFGYYTGRFSKPCEEQSSVLSISSLQADQRISACGSLASIIKSCNSTTPGFTNLPLTSQASCQCYISGGSSYAPNVFDGYVSDCFAYYSQNDPEYYSQTLHGDTALRNPCEAAGNVNGGPTATGTEASAQSFSRSAGSNTASPAVLTTTEPQATAQPNSASLWRWSSHLALAAVASLMILSIT